MFIIIFISALCAWGSVSSISIQQNGGQGELSYSDGNQAALAANPQAFENDGNTLSRDKRAFFNIQALEAFLIFFNDDLSDIPPTTTSSRPQVLTRRHMSSGRNRAFNYNRAVSLRSKVMNHNLRLPLARNNKFPDYSKRPSAENNKFPDYSKRPSAGNNKFPDYSKPVVKYNKLHDKIGRPLLRNDNAHYDFVRPLAKLTKLHDYIQPALERINGLPNHNRPAAIEEHPVHKSNEADISGGIVLPNGVRVAWTSKGELNQASWFRAQAIVEDYASDWKQHLATFTRTVTSKPQIAVLNPLRPVMHNIPRIYNGLHVKKFRSWSSVPSRFKWGIRSGWF